MLIIGFWNQVHGINFNYFQRQPIAIPEATWQARKPEVDTVVLLHHTDTVLNAEVQLENKCNPLSLAYRNLVLGLKWKMLKVLNRNDLMIG
jgi:hypothetical protein